jgi:phosphopantothenoylcysteine decarboxylase/phosphopantothenate--cysteine ligase
VETVKVVSAREMHQAVMAAAREARVVIKAAAVSDWRPVECHPHKVKKGGQGETCQLLPNPDILAELGADKGGRLLVGFAAETHDVLEHAAQKMRRKNLDLMVANDVGAQDSGFGVGTNRVHLIDPDGAVESLPLMSKAAVADRILDRVAALLGRS